MREDTYDGETVDLPKAKSKDGIRCDACPVLCLVKPNSFGACDRYTNIDGVLTRTDALVITQKPDAKVMKFLDSDGDWNGEVLNDAPIKFIMSLKHYAALGGHMDQVVNLADVLQSARHETQSSPAANPWPLAAQ